MSGCDVAPSVWLRDAEAADEARREAAEARGSGEVDT